MKGSELSVAAGVGIESALIADDADEFQDELETLRHKL
jgi:hypothetical protein